jgi:predicted lipoprotein
MTGVDNTFAATAIAWAHVMPLPIAPLLTDSRRERFFFWPDPRGITLRQIQPAIAERDATLTDPATLRTKSAALQGLGALEYLFYGTGAETMMAGDEEGQFRCRYATAITAEMVRVADELATEVGGSFTNLIHTPGPENPAYTTDNAAMGDIIVGIWSGVERARDAVLLPVLGQNIELARPRIAALWRSGLTLPFVAALVDGSKELLAAGDLAALLPADALWIVESLNREYALFASSLPTGQDIALAATDLAFRDALLLAVRAADDLKAVLGLTVPRTIALVGFNFADADG